MVIKMGVENEDTHVSHDQMVAQAQDVDAPQPPPQVEKHILDTRGEVG